MGSLVNKLFTKFGPALSLLRVTNEQSILHACPFSETQMSKLPKVLWPKLKSYGLVLALNEQGQSLKYS
jgi:hypothetical protein